MPRRYPCTTCGTHCGVNNSSVECSTCQGWVHRACAFSDDGTYDSIKALQRLQDAQSETIEKEKQGRSEKLLLETYEVKLPTLSGAADSNVLQVDKVSQDILGRFHPIMLETHVPVSVMGDGCVALQTLTISNMEVPVAATLVDYMTLASELQACCRRMTKVKGAQKLERRIRTEMKFFQTLSSKDEATQSAQLQSSNLSHFAALVHAATHLPGVTRLMRPFPAPDGRRGHGHNSLEVDVVALHGRAWVKVVARKGQALHLVWAGQGQFGERDMVQQLRVYQEVAAHHPVLFTTPTLHVAFYNGVTGPMASALTQLGVRVWGRVLPVHPDVLRMLRGVDASGSAQLLYSSDEDEDDDDDVVVEEEEESEEEGEEGWSEDCVVGNESYVGGGGGGGGNGSGGGVGCGSDSCDLVCDGGDLVCDGESEVGDNLPQFTNRDDISLDFHHGNHTHSDNDDSGRRRGDDDNDDLVCDGGDDGDLVCDREIQASAISLKFHSKGGNLDFHQRHPKSADSNVAAGVSVGETANTPLERDYDVFKPCPVPSSVKTEYACRECAAALQSRDLETDSAAQEQPDVGSGISGVQPQSRKAETVEMGWGERGEPDVSSSSSSSSSSPAWELSPRSLQGVARLLTFCPDLSRLGKEVEKEEEEEIKEKKGVGGGGGRAGEGGWSGETVNLDITTLITLVSAVCHGGCHFRFRDKVLDQQAAEERERPSLPDLMAFLKDKEWIVCRTAREDFNSIVQLLGGPCERRRAEQLLNRVRLVDDKPSERASNLRLRGKVKERSKMVFGTGDEMQAVTVTANSGFIRAAESQNVCFAVHLHPARALTELKEATATPL
ncbi:uncharacterized protein LOC143293511 [Babylonia areolata]|uniref:uncharacterized protein LOC143293511 n=1 Tax=Babylonia areolata TaxID=304850 RepID=UPI003FD5C00C